MRRKFLSVVLCMCMMLTMAPFAFAAGETESATTNLSSSSSGSGSGSGVVTAGITTEDALKKAISAASDNATIKLDRDITLTSTLNITKNITLNGDGHTISGSVASGTSFIDVSIPNNGDFTLTNCKIVPTAQVTSNAAISLSVAGKVTVTDCTFGASSDTAGHMYNGLEFSQTVPMGDTTITGNTFYGGAFRHNCISFYKMNDNATININNNNFSNLNWDTTNAVRVSNYGSNTAIINLNDNTYSDHGTTGANQSYAGLLVFQKTASNNDNFTKLTVNINNFSTTSDSQLLYVYDDNDGFITTNQPIVKGDSSISKFCSARIGDTYYSSLANAVADASTTNPDTIKLLKDTNESNIVLKKSGVLDLGGHTLDAGATNRWGLRVSNGIDVTIKNGTVKNAYSALSIWGSNDSNNPTKVTVAEDVTFTESGYGIIFTGYSQENDFTGKTGYAVLNFNGTITTEDGQCPIFVMGNLGDNADAAAAIGENGNQINIGATARITSEEEGIVLNGMAKLSVLDGAVITGSDAITMKRGYLNITGGTFTGTGDKHIPTDAEHSGAEQSGSAITVSSTYNYSGLIDVKISGGTFNSTNSYGFYAGQSVENGESITFTNTSFAISGGNFSGGEAAVYFADGKYISGGYFTTDPSTYVVEGKSALPGSYVIGDTTYNYKVDKALPSNVTVVPGATDVTAPPSMNQEDVSKIASSTIDNVSEKANEVASRLDNSKKATTEDMTNHLPAGAPTVSHDATITTVVAPRLDIEVQSYDTESKTLTLDIKAVYDIKATTANNVSSMIELNPDKSNASQVNTVTIEENAGKLDTTGTPVTVKLTLPGSFANKGAQLYVVHTKSTGEKYVHAVTVQEDDNDNNALYVEFVNDKGFSTFSISAVVAASITTNGDTTYYETLQDAVNAVQNGQTIKLEKNCDETATVSRAVNFTLNPNDKTFSGTISAGSRYSLTKTDGQDNTINYTVTYVGGGSSSGTTTSYNVNVNAATNGAVAADKKTASKGTTVTVTASPSKGYVVDAVKVVDKDGKDVAVTGKDGKYVFTMPGSAVTVTGTFKAETPTPAALPFTDVKSGNWFYDAVKYAYAQGLMTGTSATTFAPNGTMNRAMIVTVLYRLEKSPAVTGASKFTDVPAGQWYSDAVAWAAANKIVNGYDETTFGPMNAVTREQMAAILFRYEQVKGLENVTLEENLNRFPDQNKISAYAIPALQWAVGQKIINGNADGTLDPTGTATRAQVAQIFTNLLNQ